MPEAVIVATGRTPIGRAIKGSLVDCRPDDLAALVVKAVLAKVPAARPDLVEDLILGLRPAGRGGRLQPGPGGRHPGRPRRRARGDRQPLLLVVAADHPHGRPRHQGRRGRRLRRRRGGDGEPLQYGAADVGPHNPLFADAEARTAARSPSAASRGRRTTGLPDIYIAMGQTAENVAEFENVTRQEMDEFALLSQTRAVASQENGFFEREIIPVTTARRHGRHQGRRPPAEHHPRGPGQLKPVFREGGTVTAGNACPLNDGAAAVVVMSDTRAARARHHPAGPGRGERGDGPQPRDHGPRPGGGHPPDPQARPG